MGSTNAPDELTNGLGRLSPIRLTFSDPFTRREVPLSFSVGDFWPWGFSNPASNALTGCLAEYLVGRSLNAQLSVRGEWDAYNSSVDTSNPATDVHRKTGHHADGLRLVIGSA